ncbi:MAG: hypothetical protein ACJAWW_002863 [Sulfurimonas sp.]|jgi:hypothetical protein
MIVLNGHLDKFMAFFERSQILLTSELNGLYRVPSLDDEQRRQYFTLNSFKIESACRIRNLAIDVISLR